MNGANREGRLSVGLGPAPLDPPHVPLKDGLRG